MKIGKIALLAAFIAGTAAVATSWADWNMNIGSWCASDGFANCQMTCPGGIFGTTGHHNSDGSWTIDSCSCTCPPPPPPPDSGYGGIQG